MRLRLRPFLLSLGLVSLAPSAAEAFCGFYVSGVDTKVFNNATVVALMREGTRTVLSMQNNYQGPPSDFAMVVPVPVVLQKENVKTLPREIFTRLDLLAAPRLVEYWEVDPCEANSPDWWERRRPRRVMLTSMSIETHGVRVEAKFTVGEYQVVILSASDSAGLDTWLRSEKYKIPEGAEPFLRPYVQSGMKFFVAKVDPKKVKFENGSARLSPLRFHYDTETFNLPVRLGLVNSSGTQDLLVHIIAKNQRYEVANYPNVTIPTNIDVAEGVKSSFGAFYAALFDKTIEKNPGAVVTEYAWELTKCDPCPGPLPNGMGGDDVMALGADVLPSTASTFTPAVRAIFESEAGKTPLEWLGEQGRGLHAGLTSCYAEALKSSPGFDGSVTVSFMANPNRNASEVSIQGSISDPKLLRCMTKAVTSTTFPNNEGRKVGVKAKLDVRLYKASSFSASGYVITRLHTRYGKSSLGEDLVFRAAPPISGGVEVRDANGKLNHGATPGAHHQFQGRYAIRHPFTGPIACANPMRGVWGPPPNAWRLSTQPAADIAFAPRGGVDLISLVKEDVPAIGLALPVVAPPPIDEPDPDAKASPSPVMTAPPPSVPSPPPAAGGCAACTVPPLSHDPEGANGSPSGPASVLSIAALVGAAIRRLRRKRGG
jgi:hypothetical protein